MKKADCTPKQWAAHLEWSRQYRARNGDKIRARERAFHSRPEVKARRKKRQETPEAAARRRAFNKTPEAKARRAAYYAKIKNDPAKMAARNERTRRWRTGFSSADVAELMVIQNGCCGVCNRPFEGRQIRADHCHDSGKPRGLLCHHCNIIEGMLRGMKLEPIEFARRLGKFLTHPPALRLTHR